jgi:hypothetical protein
MFHFDKYYFTWLIPLAALVYFFYRKAMSLPSFYFMLMITLYAYIGICYVVIRLLMHDSIDNYPLLLMYFIITGICVILLLIKMNKKLKRDGSLQG